MSRILIVEDEESFSDPLSYLLGKEGFEVSVVDNGLDAITEFDRSGADLVLLDLQLPGLSGPQLQQRLLQRGCAPSVIFLTGHGDVSAGIDAMKLGAADFLEKPADAQVLLAAVRRAVDRHADAREHALLREAVKERLARLSTREREVLMHVVRGRLNKQIAGRLGITERTVKAHLTSAYQRIGVADRTQAALWAQRHDLGSP